MGDDAVPAPHKVAYQPKAAPDDIDAMLALVSRHAADKMFANLAPEAQSEALEHVAEYCLNLGGKRRTDVWVTLTAQLNEANPGLALQPNEVRRFCVRNVLPHIQVARSYVARAIVERGLSIDTLASTLDIRQSMEDAFQEARGTLNQTITDGNGKIIPVGTRADELAALGKAVLQANKLAASELERYGMIPEAKKAPLVGGNLNINVGGALARAAGRPIDVQYTPVDDGAPSSV